MAIDLISLQAIQDAKTQSLNEIDTHTDGSINQLNTTTDGLKAELNAETENLVVSANETISEGNLQYNRLVSTGDAQVVRVTNIGDTKYNEVLDEGDIQHNRVKSEGNTQTGRVSDEGDSQYDRINGLIQGAPTGGDAITLDGKTRTEFEADTQANTEQLQNCLQTLDDSLVAVISQQGISSNIVGANVINTGSNVIDGEGVSFVKGDSEFYIGEEYENIWERAGVYNTVEEKLTENTYKLTLIDGLVGQGYKCVNVTDTGEKMFCSLEVLEISGNGKFWTTTGGKLLTPGYNELIGGDVSGAKRYMGLGITGDTGDYIIYKKIIVTERPNKVPFVPHSFRGGELKVNESWAAETHSIIVIGSGKTDADARLRVLRDEEGLHFVDNMDAVNLDNWVALISKDFRKLYDNDRTEHTFNPLGGTSSGGIIFSPNSNTYSKFIKGIFYFDGNMTLEKMQEELAIIESGNYQLPPHFQGTTLPIEGMQSRKNNYGIVPDVIEVTDNSRDLWYVDNEAMYEVIDNDLVTHMVRVNSDLTITGTALEDISGRLRVASAISLPAQIRKVR